MEKQYVMIGKIPAILWGKPSEKLFIAVHGDQSHKEDPVISILAEMAAEEACQTLSFDLPEHGARKDKSYLCNPQNSIADLETVLEYAHKTHQSLSLFGCSLGAYFSMLAYENKPFRKALFLSPVVDMKRLIENMMSWFQISKERLKREQIITTPVKTLDWDYYEYVKSHPIHWKTPTAILYGSNDPLCEFESVSHFSNEAHAELTVMEDGEHFFHTEKQLLFFAEWLKKQLA